MSVEKICHEIRHGERIVREGPSRLLKWHVIQDLFKQSDKNLQLWLLLSAAEHFVL